MKYALLFIMSLAWSNLVHAQDDPPATEAAPAASAGENTDTEAQATDAEGTDAAGTNAEGADAEGADAEGADAEGADAEGAEADTPAEVEAPAAAPPPLVAATGLEVVSPENSSGLVLDLTWKNDSPPALQAVLRSEDGAGGPWTVVKPSLAGDAVAYTDKSLESFPADTYWYQVVALNGPVEVAEGGDLAAAISAAGASTQAVAGNPEGAFFKFSEGKYGSMLLLFLIVAVGVMMYVFTEQARKGREMKIRYIPGIAAIEEGIGRATEMGRPVLYVPGIGGLDDIQTIASMLVLGEVSHKIAEYQTDVIVSCVSPMVREVADEVVRSGFFRAGHPDAFDPTSVRFIAADQFAFTAGTNGIMYREGPSTNLYMGTFFAESLILAETGFINKAVQIAGTASTHQLPFFIAACDYTLIGEELFALSAYLTRDPQIVSSLKASDWFKVVSIVLLALGVISMSLGYDLIFRLFLTPEG